MEIIDSHVHLYPTPNLDKECHISDEPIAELLYNLSQKIRDNNISRAVVYILDSDFNSKSQNIEIPNNLMISTVVDIDGEYINDLEKAFNNGVKIIKILPYEQNITKDKYFKVREIAEFAEEKGMVLTICSTYGSKLLYDSNGIELAAHIKKKVDVPIILAHGGGPKIFDAMTMALEYDDIFLDLSFSLKYWWNSSVIKDYAFAIKKLECKKCFYGSDYPFVSFNESIKYFSTFMDKYHFSDDDKNNILHSNFTEFNKAYLDE